MMGRKRGNPWRVMGHIFHHIEIALEEADMAALVGDQIQPIAPGVGSKEIDQDLVVAVTKMARGVVKGMGLAACLLHHQMRPDLGVCLGKMDCCPALFVETCLNLDQWVVIGDRPTAMTMMIR